MSRYGTNRFPAASGHAAGIEEAVNDFLLHHQRKGDSESYLRELRSYLIGGSGCFGKRRAWLPFMPWVAKRNYRISAISRRSGAERI